MNTLPLRFISAGLFFLLIIPSGLWLSHTGKPYSLVLFNVHKLIGFGLFVFLAINAYWLNQATVLSTPARTACLIAALFFAATIVTGGLVSVPRALPAAISSAHKLLPYLTVLSTVLGLFVLFRQR